MMPVALPREEPLLKEGGLSLVGELLTNPDLGLQGTLEMEKVVI